MKRGCPILFLIVLLMVHPCFFQPEADAREGLASWYSSKDRGVKHHTANGERFDASKKTCASWHYKFGTKLKVVNKRNGKSVTCRVNDRGPAKRLKRVIDLSRSAFMVIESPQRGLASVKIIPAD